ncbi:MAG: adenosylcobinamide-GDP ribazoletransferase [Candidatus Omnitrophota bacterium]
MKKFLIALQFLTILPVKIKTEVKNEDHGGSLLYFPVVGLIIGLLLCAVLFLCRNFPIPVRSVLILIASVVVTGGIHLDGFADTCDGFYVSGSGARALEVMKDSRIGAIGAIGLVCLLLLKFALISGIPGGVLWRALIMAVSFARWIQVLMCYKSECARKGGTAACFIDHCSGREFLIGGIFTMILFFVLAGAAGLVIMVLSLLPPLGFMLYANKKISGMTGDTIGAASEIAEVSVLFFALIWMIK